MLGLKKMKSSQFKLMGKEWFEKQVNTFVTACWKVFDPHSSDSTGNYVLFSLRTFSSGNSIALWTSKDYYCHLASEASEYI